MKLKSIFVFFILGGSIIFVGLPVKDYVTREDNFGKDPVINESLVLLSILSILGIAIFIIIKILEIILDKKFMSDLLKHGYRHPQIHYTYN